MSTKKGFTLVETLIVISILAVLAAMIIPRFTGQDERGYIAEAVGMLSAIRQAEASYRLENSSYASDPALLDVDVSSSTKFTYTITATSTPSFTAQAKRVDGKCKDRTITLNDAGTYGGDHPYGPTAGSGACNS